MGWTARDLADASLWQVLAAYDGWRKANSPEDDDEDGLTDSEFDQAGALLDAHLGLS